MKLMQSDFSFLTFSSVVAHSFEKMTAAVSLCNNAMVSCLISLSGASLKELYHNHHDHPII